MVLSPEKIDPIDLPVAAWKSVARATWRRALLLSVSAVVDGLILKISHAE